MWQRMFKVAAPHVLVVLVLAVGCGARTPAASPHMGSAPSTIPEAVSKAVDASDRSAADRALDAGRRPAETFAFFGVEPGDRVAELAAGGGYSAELLARIVGPSGMVYGVNSPFLLNRFAQEPWAARLRKPVMQNVIRVDRDFDDPLPPEATGLDAVLCILFYHDFFWQDVDRASMNRAVFTSLKQGGVYGIVDHAARNGAGTDDVKSLHRIERDVVVDEIEAAGFRLVAEGQFLRNALDPMDWNAAPSAAGSRRGTSDRFVLKFIKP
ncbi:MAG: class I SAM-dependent methyltransferase [Myxococcota bacterium]